MKEGKISLRMEKIRAGVKIADNEKLIFKIN